MRMVAETKADYDSEWAAMAKVSGLHGVRTPETVRKGVRQWEVDVGSRAGTTSEESGEVRRLRRENAELKQANAILKAASAFFAAKLDGALPVIVGFIREPGGLCRGVEPTTRTSRCFEW